MAKEQGGRGLLEQWLRWDVAASVVGLVVLLWLAFAWTVLFEALAGLLGSVVGAVLAAHGAGVGLRRGGAAGWARAGLLGVIAVFMALLGVDFLGDLAAFFRTP